MVLDLIPKIHYLNIMNNPNTTQTQTQAKRGRTTTTTVRKTFRGQNVNQSLLDGIQQLQGQLDAIKEKRNEVQELSIIKKFENDCKDFKVANATKVGLRMTPQPTYSLGGFLLNGVVRLGNFLFSRLGFGPLGPVKDSLGLCMPVSTLKICDLRPAVGDLCYWAGFCYADTIVKVMSGGFNWIMKKMFGWDYLTIIPYVGYVMTLWRELIEKFGLAFPILRYYSFFRLAVVLVFVLGSSLVKPELRAVVVDTEVVDPVMVPDFDAEEPQPLREMMTVQPVVAFGPIMTSFDFYLPQLANFSNHYWRILPERRLSVKLLPQLINQKTLLAGLKTDIEQEKSRLLRLATSYSSGQDDIRSILAGADAYRDTVLFCMARAINSPVFSLQSN